MDMGVSSRLNRMLCILLACCSLLLCAYVFYRDDGLSGIASVCHIDPNSLFHFQTLVYKVDQHGFMFSWISAEYRGESQVCFDDLEGFRDQVKRINNSLGILPESLMQRIDNGVVVGKVIEEYKDNIDYTGAFIVFMDMETRRIDLVLFLD
jgi:hypothetical protein